MLNLILHLLGTAFRSRRSLILENIASHDRQVAPPLLSRGSLGADLRPDGINGRDRLIGPVRREYLDQLFGISGLGRTLRARAPANLCERITTIQ